ncbi:hypothetical protein MANY_18290 [Mycolicibacterium anyangense]|jgi:hypothetical protein|uniref:DUF2561 domain-containing protein n=1 Tax=Mycolicibacterium anyangense TaxID=1431246 RepID=A0A6N4W8U3_9MYCO|nr:DUF2561 family protein [Mycolicibacterium anyangense]BBZ76492.1 hypothetical protein MANY_18290 [Mycolicibacterium anyangense]
MARDTEFAGPGATEDNGRSPETVDRILVGICGAIWLVLLAVTVIAIVALVDLGRGHTLGGDGKQTPWVLYSVIVVSALIIVGAIPLLLRARHAALAEPAPPAAAKPAAATPSAAASASGRPVEAPTEKLKVFGATVDPYEPYQPAFAQSSTARADLLIPRTQLDRLWLRGTVTLMGAIGLALVGVSLATYLLAVASDTAAWVALGLAAVVTIAMPVIPVFYLRELRNALDGAVPAA